MRMPELSHYSDDTLNTGYVFTNVEDFSIEGDIAGDYFRINSTSRLESYTPISLLSVHAKRHREETRLNPAFFNVRRFCDTAGWLISNFCAIAPTHTLFPNETISFIILSLVGSPRALNTSAVSRFNSFDKLVYKYLLII